MTMPIRIDTLKYAQLLKEAGLPAEQAELQAEALGTVLNECHVAMESDLVIQRSELLARMDLLKQELFGQLDLTHQELLAKLDLFRQEVHSRIDAVTQELSSKIDAVEQALYGRITSLETKVYVFFGIQFVVDALLLAKLYF